MGKKYIIALSSPDCTGKTCVFHNIWDLLPCYLPEEKILLEPYERDSSGAKIPVKLAFDFYGHVMPLKKYWQNKNPIFERNYKIGVSSRGDTVEMVLLGFDVIQANTCDVIICACRTERMLIDAIDIMAKPITLRDWKFKKYPVMPELKEYEIITTGPFCKSFDRKSLKKNNSSIPMISHIVKSGDVNLSRFTARGIVNLVERLME